MDNGKILKELPTNLDLRTVEIVLVTGAGPNICGHVLLHVVNGHYFHFDGPNVFDYPRYLTEFEYRTYLNKTKKKELTRKRLPLKCPDQAKAKLLELMNRKWGTLILSHNCASFVAEILYAGGSFWEMPQHCPRSDMYISLFIDKVFPSRGRERKEREYICR